MNTTDIRQIAQNEKNEAPKAGSKGGFWMRFEQKWTGVRIPKNAENEYFLATVPGNIQQDYAVSRGWGDAMFGENCRRYEALEDDSWAYLTRLSYERRDGERVWFVSGGIDYRYDILLNHRKLYAYEGLVKPVEIDLTDFLTGDDELCVFIYPHPKRAGAWRGTRDEADASCKPPVCYGWDWNPRLLISGMWQEAYIETRDSGYIDDCEPTWHLSPDFERAEISFAVRCEEECTVSLFDAEGECLYCGNGERIILEKPHLWWCCGQGEPYLYRFVAESRTDRKEGTLGLRRVRLLRNPGTKENSGFPKSRYPAPITLELNGRRIFLKGSNFVNADIFWGRIERGQYDVLTDLARDANMNILRVWGGASVCKKDFYEFCDKKGLMVWQEFMLACNAYPDEEHYLSVLESEATAMVLALRRHPSIVLWCGGNELFNGWSGMSEQSLPLRMLGSLCYLLDRDCPFLMTSPLEGMAHGGYLFYDKRYAYGDVYRCFQEAHNTAYAEFGVPSISAMDALKRIIPEKELDAIRDTPSWRLHHAFGAWMPQSHACVEILEKYFGNDATVEERIAQSDWLQCEGLKAIFEEARRQSPYCSAALNWSFNEPWMTAANLSIVRYPAVPKPGYYAVREALRPVLFSARIPRFDWRSGERFTAGIWLLNDSPASVRASVTVSLRIGDTVLPLLSWRDAVAEAGKNTEGASVCCVLPAVDTDRMELILRTEDGQADSRYLLRYDRVKEPSMPKGMNL